MRQKDETSPATTDAGGNRLRTIKSRDLFDCDNRIRIEHEGIEYLLQITRQGKLILTK